MNTTPDTSIDNDAVTNETETVTHPRRYTRRSESQWRELIVNFEQSDLGVEAYCQHHKIAISGFYSWRKRFATSHDKNDMPDAFINIAPTLADQSTAVQPVTPWQVELSLGAGCVLRINTASHP